MTAKAPLYDDLLRDVINDKFSGAWVVARKTIKCIEAVVAQTATWSRDEIVSELVRVAGEILKAQPGMAQLVNLFNTVFNTIDAEKMDDTVVLGRKITGETKRFHELASGAVAKVAEYGADLIEEDNQVFIHSNSSTIFEILRKAREKGRTFEVLLTESRPVAEGRACARELAKLGINSTFFVDAAAAKGIERADIVLLGADTVSEIRLVNKVGTKGICLLAREAVLPCYAACESSKFIPQKLGPRKEQPRNPTEVWDNPPSETKIENYYFDDVSLELFTGIITEEGILTPEEIGGRILAQQMNKRLLDLLR